MIAPQFPFASRVAQVRATLTEMELDAIVVTHPPNIRYLTGFSGSTAALVIDRRSCNLIVDFRYLTSARDLARAAPDLPMTVVLAERNEDDTIVSVLGASEVQRIGIEAAWMPVARFNRLSSGLASHAPTPLNSPRPCPVLAATERVVERARVVKDAHEIDTLRRAAALLSSVARDVVPRILAIGRRESEIAASIDAALREAGFERPAFETIVASGPQSALPHARPGSRVLQPGDPVLLDFGGVYNGYCVDLTRTVLLAPSTTEFRRIFAAVAEAQRAGIAAVRPGALTADIDHAARTTLERHGLAEAFGHGTGHGLGLEVHEEPRISKGDPARPPRPLEAGMVFTIEPGVYVPEMGGVRIEDDVLVVDGGCEVLTQVPVEIGK